MSWFIAHFPLNAIITDRTNITPCWSATKLFIEVIKEGIYIRSDESGGVDLQFKAWSARHIQKLSVCYTISEADSGHKTLQWKTKRRKRLIKWIYLSFLLIYQRAQSKQNCRLLCASSLLFRPIHEKYVSFKPLDIMNPFFKRFSLDCLWIFTWTYPNFTVHVTFFT